MSAVMEDILVCVAFGMFVVNLSVTLQPLILEPHETSAADLTVSCRYD